MNEYSLTTFAALVAIDWADEKHDLALLPAGAEQAEHLQLPHRPEALAQWISGLRQRFGGQAVAVAVSRAPSPPMLYVSPGVPFSSTKRIPLQ